MSFQSRALTRVAVVVVPLPEGRTSRRSRASGRTKRGVKSCQSRRFLTHWHRFVVLWPRDRQGRRTREGLERQLIA